jgi:aminopeptidase N
VGQVAIRTYYFAGHEDAAAKMTHVATQAVGLFEPKFAPYPYPVLNVVELDYNDGQENDGLIFLSSAFFDQFGGGVKNNMTTIGVHEIAHNWWFGLVGNDQAMEPWLDEALSLYSERIFYEYTNPDLLDWWWQFRVNYFGPNGWVDMSVYDPDSFRTYTNGVYLNGATFMEDLRVRMGDDNFYRFIKDYAGQMSYRRATGSDFFAIARQHTSADLSDLIAAYFRNSY